MNTQLDFVITPQPDDTTCGPSCLHAVYRYYGDDIPLDDVIRDVKALESGGTLAGFLGMHALRRGYQATIYTCNLRLFDPTWFFPEQLELRDRLIERSQLIDDARMRGATRAYLDYLALGGRIVLEGVTAPLIARILQEGSPIITGLSATWLYRCKRERPADAMPDDIAGEPVGHFIVVHGLDLPARIASVSDPFYHEPFPASHRYEVNVDRLIVAILLGVVTYDEILVVRPPRSRRMESPCPS